MQIKIKVTESDMDSLVREVIERQQREVQSALPYGGVNAAVCERNSLRKSATYAFQGGDIERAIGYMNSANNMEIEIARLRKENFTRKALESVNRLNGKMNVPVNDYECAVSAKC